MRVIGYVCDRKGEIEYFSSDCHSFEVEEYVLKAKHVCYNELLNRGVSPHHYVAVDIVYEDGTVKRW